MSRRGINTLISFINSLSLLLGLAALISRIIFNVRLGSWGEKLHPNPLVDLGFVLLGMSLLRYVVLWYFPGYNKRVKVMYSLSMFAFIIVAFSFVVFALIVTNKGEGREIPGRAYNDYYDKDYSSWLHSTYVKKNVDWYNMRIPLQNSQLCANFARQFNHLNASEFYKLNLSPLQSGCCKPPTHCDFQCKNATVCTRRYQPYLRDCMRWLGEEKVCYNCTSCKAGFLANIKMEWRHMAVTNICILLFLIIVYIARYITKIIQKDRKYSGYVQATLKP